MAQSNPWPRKFRSRPEKREQPQIDVRLSKEIGHWVDESLNFEALIGKLAYVVSELSSIWTQKYTFESNTFQICRLQLIVVFEYRPYALGNLALGNRRLHHTFCTGQRYIVAPGMK